MIVITTHVSVQVFMYYDYKSIKYFLLLSPLAVKSALFGPVRVLKFLLAKKLLKNLVRQ